MNRPEYQTQRPTGMAKHTHDRSAELDEEALYAELNALFEEDEEQERNEAAAARRQAAAQPPGSSPDSEDLKDAKLVIDKVMVATKSESLASGKPSAEPVESTVPRIPSKLLPAAAATRFAISEVKSLVEIASPRSRLDSLVIELSGHLDYRRIREEYCQLSILINLEGLVAPAFRPALKISKAKGHIHYLEIHRDQVVIDGHWLHTKGERVKVRDPILRELFDLKRDFNFWKAWAFANEKWTSTHRVDEVLYLTTRQQCQLMALQGKVVAARHERATKGTRALGVRLPPKLATVRQQLNEWGERNPRIVDHLQDYEDLWMAQELLGPDAPVKHVVEIFELTTGVKRDEKTVRGKLKTLNDNIREVK